MSGSGTVIWLYEIIDDDADLAIPAPPQPWRSAPRHGRCSTGRRLLHGTAAIGAGAILGGILLAIGWAA